MLRRSRDKVGIENIFKTLGPGSSYQLSIEVIPLTLILINRELSRISLNAIREELGRCLSECVSILYRYRYLLVMEKRLEVCRCSITMKVVVLHGPVDVIEVDTISHNIVSIGNITTETGQEATMMPFQRNVGIGSRVPIFIRGLGLWIHPILNYFL